MSDGLSGSEATAATTGSLRPETRAGTSSGRPSILTSVAPGTGRRDFSWLYPSLPDFLLDPKERLKVVVAVLALALGLFGFVTAGAVSWVGFQSMPMQDNWDYWRLSDDLSRDTLKTLFSQHNEHRIAALRLFLMADHHWFNASGFWMLGCNLLFLLITAVVIWRMATRDRSVSPAYSLFVLGTVTAILFSAQQFDNLTWTFQVGFLVAFTGAVWSFAAFAAGSRSPSVLHFALWTALAVFSAMLATYSLASGLLIWIFLIPLALTLRISWQRVLLTVVLGAFFVGTYLTGYESPGHHAKPSDSITELFRVIGFVLTYVGSPADELIHNAMLTFGIGTEQYRAFFSALAGFFVLAAGGWFCIDVFTRGRDRDNSGEVVLVHTLLFITACGFITALGRINFGIGAALSTRYATPALIYWAALAGLFLLRKARQWDSPEGARRQWFVVAVVFLLFSSGQMSRVGYAREWRAAISDGPAAIAAGVYDRDAWLKVYHSHHFMIRPLAEMRQKQLGPFNDPLLALTGKRASDHFSGIPYPLPGSKLEQTLAEQRRLAAGAEPPAAAPAPAEPVEEFEADEPAEEKTEQGVFEGNIDAVGGTQSSMMSGHFVTGWAWDGVAKKAPEAIIVLDERGIIRGIDRCRVSRSDVKAAKPVVTTNFTGFKVYVPGNRAESLWTYAVLSDKSARLIGGPKQAGEIYPTWPINKVGAVIRRMKAAPQGVFRQSSAGLPAPPPGIVTVFSSFEPESAAASAPASTTGGTGTVEIGPFDTKGTIALGMPIVTGATTGRLSVEVVDAKTGMVLCSLTPPPTLQAWSVWRIDLPALQGLSVKIVVRDRGDQPQEFIAVSYPRRLLP